MIIKEREGMNYGFSGDHIRKSQFYIHMTGIFFRINTSLRRLPSPIDLTWQ